MIITNWPSPRFSQLANQLSQPQLYERAYIVYQAQKVSEDVEDLVGGKRLNYISITKICEIQSGKLL